MFAIADVIGADWPERIREAAAILVPAGVESTGPMLLADIKAVFDLKAQDRLASSDLCEGLAAMEGRPWPEWRAESDDRRLRRSRQTNWRVSLSHS